MQGTFVPGGISLPMRIAVGACLSLICLRAFASDADSLEIEVSTARLAGRDIADLQTVEDIDDGHDWALASTWRFAPDWRLSGRYGRTRVRYQDPSNIYCPISAGLILHYEFCQASLPEPAGRLEDRLEQYELGLWRSWDLGSRASFEAGLGYASLRWQSEGDEEASTYSSCLANRVPVPVPGCVPIGERAAESGWTGDLRFIWRFSNRLSGSLGMHRQSFRYQIYRNEAVARFCTANLQAGDCRFIPAAAEGAWQWWRAELAWVVSDHWTLALAGESGGTRDWEVLSALVRFGW